MRIDGASVLLVADLATAIPTRLTRHVVGDVEVGDFAGLAIVRYEGEAGVYLFYCDEDWHSVTDTFHETVEEALEQAEHEFAGVEFSEVPA